MANTRKIQSEIDKLMKKVQEGCEIYDEGYEKVNTAPNQVLKEKFEADLKKEIKKLQRHRETIKGLIANPEVKDKKALETARRQIETKMESFKVCERETKTKAFSKEGLASRADPADTPKAMTEQWIKQAISDLGEQLEQIEFEVESGGGTIVPTKKSKKKPVETPAEIKMRRTRLHILKLEQVLRCLVNDDIMPEEADDIADQVQQFVDSNAEEGDPDAELDEIYDVFDLPEVTGTGLGEESEGEEAPQASPMKPAAPTPKIPEKKKEEEVQPAGGRVIMKAKVDTPPMPAPAKAAVKAVAAVAVAPQLPAKQPSPAAAPIVTVAKKQVPAQPTPKQIASPVAQSSRSVPLQQPLESDGLDDDMDAANEDTFGDDAMPPVGGQTGTLAELSSMSHQIGGDWEKGRPKMPTPQQPAPKTVPVAQAPPAAAAQQPQPVQQLPQQQQPPQSQSPLQQTQPQLQSSQPPQQQQPQIPQPHQSPQQQPAAAPVSQQIAPQFPRAAPSADRLEAQRLLSMSARNLPHLSDCEKLKQYCPPNPYKTPPYYPSQVHPGFSSPEMFRKFESSKDTLFFIFYYQQGTYQQYLAAKELKRTGWRFHKKFLTWFQRHEKPKAEYFDYEEGSCLYFDYENGWCQRVKSDFVFKYQYLENELV